MTKTFIQTTQFTKNWERLQLTDEDLRRLELELLKNPDSGQVVKGTGKLRKMRFAFQGKGKRGSIRVCYVDFVVYDVIYLITAYTKNEKDNLTKAECNAIKEILKRIEKQLQEKEDT